ncbi:MAG: PP2C family protein-serine/threonine phosphatase [Mycobacteriales bacterium]
MPAGLASAAPLPFDVATHVGLVREENEDAYAVAGRAWVVADGLGGHSAGEVASRLAAKAALRHLMDDSESGPPISVADRVRAALLAGHAAVLDAIRADRALAGMGTTLVVAVVDPQGTLTVGNVGDSRAYLLASGRLRRLTVDDNLAEVLVSTGELTTEEARVHPARFQLSQVIGGFAGDEPRVGLTEVPGAFGRLMLCTDGLTSEVPEAQLAVGLAGELAGCAQRLVDAALAGGGNDNITAVVVDLPEDDPNTLPRVFDLPPPPPLPD